MMISTRGRYALRVMLDMAERGGGEWLCLRDIAQRQQLSKKYLESIMAALSRAELVEGTVGRSGGYRLTRPPEEYPVGEILRAVEGDLSPIARRARGAAAPATATPGFSGRGWRIRSIPTSTTIRWRSLCAETKQHRTMRRGKKIR